jgi:DNA-directed RNA polymerase subunit F
MMVKRMEEEELLTISESKEILMKLQDDISKDVLDDKFVIRRAIEHSKLFSYLSPEKSRELVEELLALEKVRMDIAIKIANLLPRNNDELRAIYAKERFTLSKEELQEILTIVVKYI